MEKTLKYQRSLIKKKIKISEDKFIVMLDYMNFEEPNRNIFCINSQDEILWQVEADPKRVTLPGGSDLDSFVSIKFDSNLVARRFSGFEYQVDLLTGKIKLVGWDK